VTKIARAVVPPIELTNPETGEAEYPEPWKMGDFGLGFLWRGDTVMDEEHRVPEVFAWKYDPVRKGPQHAEVIPQIVPMVMRPPGEVPMGPDGQPDEEVQAYQDRMPGWERTTDTVPFYIKEDGSLDLLEGATGTRAVSSEEVQYIRKELDDAFATNADNEFNLFDEEFDSFAHTANDFAAPQMNPGHVPQPQENVPAPQNTCPYCGAARKEGEQNCPNCGASTINTPMQPLAKQAADHQGPHNKEQFAAVAELLIEEGREQEVPEMLKSPWDYGEEMSRAQNKLQPPPIDESQDASPPQPAQENAPPGDTMPVPNMSIPGGSNRPSAPMTPMANTDAQTPRCPKCHSGSTGLESEEGTCSCHSCGHRWKQEVEKDLTASVKTADAPIDNGYRHEELHENPSKSPAADRVRQRDVRKEQDPSRRWKDITGKPLVVGQEYEMTSKMYDIPDLVLIERIKPDGIDVTFTGEYGLSHSTEIPRDEAQVEGYEFKLAESLDDQEKFPEEHERKPSGDELEDQPGDQTDLSEPHMKMTKEEKPHLAWLKEKAPDTVPEEWSKEAGQHYTPFEQRDFIDEQGEARNKDKLKLDGTHYADEDDDEFLFGL
jgi:uncharacterized Zn finger protein (UPF0148 family)